EATSDYPQTFNQRNPLCKSYMMFCVDLRSSRHSLLRKMYLKSTCRNSGRKRDGSDSSTTPPTQITTVVAARRLTAAAKGKQPARATNVNDQTKGRDDNEGEKTNESDADDDDQDETE
nr:hypothetical protein [Tanacetum cinerariifolium]